MKKLDETSIIETFQKGFGRSKFVSEDVETFSLGRNKIVAKTDTMVQSTDIPSQMRLSDAARKSVVACVSDFASKGVRPSYGMISVNLPKTVSPSEVRQITSGFGKAAREFGILILGGDTNEGRELVFNVCLFGVAEKIVARSGSRKGDLIFVTGPFGYTSAGLDMIQGRKRGSTAFIKRATDSFTRPRPRLDFGIKGRKYFSSSMDSSDGLSVTLNEMSRQSKKRFIITKTPALKDVRDFAVSTKSSLDEMVFNGGEEYEFAFTVRPSHRKAIIKSAGLLKTPIMEIGFVTSGKGVYVQRDRKLVRLKDDGWKHFK